MFKVNKFKNGKNSYVTSTININDLLDQIKNGTDNLPKIKAIRDIGKSNILFNDIKLDLPSVCFNFLFDKKKTNDNIIASTGLIYIDIDACDTIDNSNPYIFSSWKSISNTGFGCIVKVDGLTKDNYKETYEAISNELGLKSDIGARKATQQTIISFDPNLYYNSNSLTFSTKNIKGIIQSYTEKKKRKELILLNDTFNTSDTIRFNNISDYFIDNQEQSYIVLEEKEKICSPFIPKRVNIGDRNRTMFFSLSQYALLNPTCNINFLISIAGTINERFVEKYSDEKIKSICGSIITKRENKTLQPYFNEERRILFNPKIKMTAKEKRTITAKEVGKVRKDKTRSDIYLLIEGWDFTTHGEINQKKVATISGKGIATIKRNWSDVKDLVKVMNQDNNEGINYEIKLSDLSNDNLEDEVEDVNNIIVEQKSLKVMLFEVRSYFDTSNKGMRELFLNEANQWDGEKINYYYDEIMKK